MTDEHYRDVTHIDKGATGVFRAYPGDTWRQAPLFDVVAVVIATCGLQDKLEETQHLLEVDRDLVQTLSRIAHRALERCQELDV